MKAKYIITGSWFEGVLDTSVRSQGLYCEYIFLCCPGRIIYHGTVGHRTRAWDYYLLPDYIVTSFIPRDKVWIFDRICRNHCHSALG